MVRSLNISDIGRVIAAVRTEVEFEAALSSHASLIFDLSPDLMKLPARIKRAKAAQKKLFLHIDLAKGIGRDESGIAFLRGLGIEGIVSTKVSMIKLAREKGLFTVQRFFIVDSQSVHTTVEAVKASSPDVIEVMPGIACKVIARLHESLDIPLIAGGLIENEEELEAAMASGASAVSTGRAELWDK
ncbi:MAG: glycerol-3-phosphate responsive antiterminator [Clostridia bacterium]|nr:glycerol-3-phosphate responsive antiterminator [Clostridia bacterium]